MKSRRGWRRPSTESMIRSRALSAKKYFSRSWKCLKPDWARGIRRESSGSLRRMVTFLSLSLYVIFRSTPKHKRGSTGKCSKLPKSHFLLWKGVIIWPWKPEHSTPLLEITIPMKLIAKTLFLNVNRWHWAISRLSGKNNNIIRKDKISLLFR